MKTTFLHWRTKLFFTAVICSLFSNAFGDHGGGSHINVNLSVPGTSSTGNYTVTWTNNADQSLGEIEDLQEKTTGAYANVYTGYNGSVSFYSKPSATYSYRVRYKMCFFSSCSYSYSLPEPIVVSSGSPPGVPGNLTVPVTAADNGSGASYDVTWSDSSGSADYYALDRKTSTTNWTNIQYNSSLSKSESGMSADTYMYRVRGCNAQGCSANSAIETTVVMLDNITSAPSVQTAGAVGTAPYALRADTDGDTVISVPLSLIPGVAGFAPTLSLEYDSGRGVERLERSLPEDSIGYGWKLGGLSQIRRCVVNQASGNSIQLNNNDSLCLDGMPLVTASGTHFATGTVYRTLIESFARIEIKDDSGDRWFEVKFPDGTVREYGRTFDSRVNQNGGTDFQWSLNKETSADGNVIYYTYYVDIANGINYITNINYTGANVDFEYRTRTDAASVSIGTSTQTQTVFLHTIRVRYTGFKVREYRLLDEVVSGHRRLNELQLCGFNEIGSTMTCLEPTNFGWMTPTSTMAGVDILVDGISDGLGAVHQIEYGTITGSSHPFLFTERPFGNGTPPSDTQLLSGSGALRHVTTKIRRDNGLGGFHDTTYAYQNRGLESTKHWGFLGFYAQRVTDVPSGLVTYVQIRVDYPYFGKAARFLRLDANYGSHSATLIRVENDYAQQSIVHSAGITEYPYAAETTSFKYEGSTLLGATQTNNSITFVGGLIDQYDRSDQIGTGVSTGSPGSTWGDVPAYTLSGINHTTQKTVQFDNRTTGTNWLIGFADSLESESWTGAPSGSGIYSDATLTPDPSLMRIDTVTAFPNHSRLTLTTDYTYDASGRLTAANITGDNVASRDTTVTDFWYDRYPKKITNDLGQDTTLSDYDWRFGTVEIRGDRNGRNTSWDRDPFGRVTSVTNPDGVVTATTYSDCTSGCPAVYGVTPYFTSQTTVTHSSTTLAPVQKTYFDVLGRVLRTETQSFDGTNYSKEDFYYDALGRVNKASLPYFSGTAPTVVTTYDDEGRVANVSRPDGSSTVVDYTTSGNLLIETITENIKNADGTSAGSQIKRNEFNILGQLEKTTDAYGTSDATSVSYAYDANGNVVTAVVDGGTDGTTTTTYEWDEVGNRTKIIGPDVGTVISTYTALSELDTVTDAKSQVTDYDYDTLGRIKTVDNVDGTSTWVWDSATNGEGKLESKSIGTAFEEVFTYDTNSRLSTITTNITPIGGGTSTAYTTTKTYDTHGRLVDTTYPASNLTVTRTYNARGYLSALKNGTTSLKTIVDQDAFGNSTEEDFANGVTTTRTYNPDTGRLTDLDTTKSGSILQDSNYDWRSNGTLEARTSNPVVGINSTRKESFTYDFLNRIKKAETFINSTNTRDLDYDYTRLGNIKSKTSTLSGDTDVTGYAYGAGSAGPHAVTSFSVNGVSRTQTYDGNGAVTKYDISGTTDDKYIAYNGYSQPTKIVVGQSINDTTPVAVDEIAYDPDGDRSYRKTTWQDGGTHTENVAYIGDVEVITDDIADGIDKIVKTRVAPNIIHVAVTSGTTTTTHFEYAHRDFLGSIEVVTDDSGLVLDNLAFEPFGPRKAANWSSNISNTEVALLLDRTSTHSPKVRGFTGHEHLDRTGLIHMNGRIYDPALGRFLSPDPVVQFPESGQSWNRYSYVNNSPTSFVDPTGFTEEEIPEIVTTGERWPSGFPSRGGWFGGSGGVGPAGGGAMLVDEDFDVAGDNSGSDEIIVVGKKGSRTGAIGTTSLGDMFKGAWEWLHLGHGALEGAVGSGEKIKRMAYEDYTLYMEFGAHQDYKLFGGFDWKAYPTFEEGFVAWNSQHYHSGDEN